MVKTMINYITAHQMLVNKLNYKLVNVYSKMQIYLYRYRFKHELCNFIRDNFNMDNINSNYSYFVFHANITEVVNKIVLHAIEVNKAIKLSIHIQSFMLWLLEEESKINLMNHRQYLKLLECYALF